ncbi:dihydrofolate reductase [Alteribacillus iranensis]|uniref:Dihydrofolate reductase n=1 Tax=Alteribacillus iranensis TaxID=930128 RepID=A0A1I2EP21_9BACI|nr:dihydrofolate reductase [Alteribacillus iranensis]SFE94595.1 dihydrofolate reductase [Alteribacillus iranensis]
MISFIAAMDENRVIGKDNQLPWYLPADLKHFKSVTNGHPIVMGRKTFESIGRPLPGRRNIIVTSNRDYHPEGCEVIHSVEELSTYKDVTEEVFVIGGETLFQQAFPLAERLYVTIIHETFTGDTFFPHWKEDEWHIVEKREGKVDEKNKFPHTYLTLEKIK